MTPHAAILIEPSAKNTAAAICAAALALDAHVKCPIMLGFMIGDVTGLFFLMIVMIYVFRLIDYKKAN